MYLETALTRCYFCNEPDKIILNTRLTPLMARKVEEIHNHVIDMDPCNKCREYMENGVILITINPAMSEDGWNKKPMPNPYRTGGFFVITKDAAARILGDSECGKFAAKHGWMFIEHKAAEKLGLFDMAKRNN